MPTSTIYPATYGGVAKDPSTVSPGRVKRARRVAKRAKAILEDKGWVQATGEGPNGERCLTAALEAARAVKSKSGLLPLSHPKMFGAVLGILEEARPKVTRKARPFSYSTSLIEWNDRPNRTKEQVLALLEKAANG